MLFWQKARSSRYFGWGVLFAAVGLTAFLVFLFGKHAGTEHQEPPLAVTVGQAPPVSNNVEPSRAISTRMPDIAKLPQLDEEMDAGVSFTNVVGSPVYKEYQSLLENAVSLGNKESFLRLLDSAVTLEAQLLRPAGDAAEKQSTREEIVAAAQFLKDLGRVIQSLPQMERFPELKPLADLALLSFQLHLNNPNLYTNMPSPASLVEAVRQGARVEDMDSQWPNLRSLHMDPEGQAAAARQIDSMASAPPYEDRLLEKYRQWHQFMAEQNLQALTGTTTFDLSALNTRMEAPLEPDLSRERAFLGKKIDLQLNVFAAHAAYHAGASQVWNGPEDVIAAAERRTALRGFPVREALFRIDEAEQAFGDVMNESDKVLFKSLRSKLDLNPVEAQQGK